ncbi:MAG: hypothetical protein NZT61_03865, partial [Deltaproteobacteria bacterium]|nr:hypothetical protein [Deltaproteobacteria bacterium]
VFCLPVVGESTPKPMYFLEEDLETLAEQEGSEYRELLSAFYKVTICWSLKNSVLDAQMEQELLEIIEENLEKAVLCMRFRDFCMASKIDGFAKFYSEMNDNIQFYYTAVVGAAHVPGIREDLLNQGWDVVADFSVYESNSPKVKIYNQERFELLEREFLRRLALLGRS